MIAKRIKFRFSPGASWRTIGVVSSMAVTYTPQYNPHYYLPWQDQTTGPSTVASTGRPDLSPINILAGPVVNPANGHAYYLLARSTWSDAEAQAVRLGGHLATIRSAQENQWIFSTFGRYGGALWIGLTDREKAFAFTWTSGERARSARLNFAGHRNLAKPTESNGDAP